MVWLPHLLRRHGGFAALAVLSIAVTVGAAGAVMTVVDALFAAPPSVQRAHELMSIGLEGQTTYASRWYDRALAEFGTLPFVVGAEGQAVRGLTAFDVMPRVRLAGDTTETEVLGVTTGYFTLLGVPVFGRQFTADDNQPGAPLVAIISDRLWSRRFDRHPEALGATLEATVRPITIIGVAAPGFAGALRGEQFDVWIPHHQLPGLAGVSETAGPYPDIPLLSILRLRPGGAEALSAWAADRFRGGPRGARQVVVPIGDLFGAGNRPIIRIAERSAFLTLSLIAGLVVLGGTLTLAGLFAVHFDRRRGEFGIRRTLGASTASLSVLMGREVGLITVAGMGGAWAATWTAVHAMPAFALPSGVLLERLDLSITARVTVGIVLTTVVMALLASAWPLGRAARSSLRSSTGARVRRWWLAGHAATTATLILLTATLARAVDIASADGPAFSPDQTIFVSLRAWSERRSAGYETERAAAAARLQALRSALLVEPGVSGAALGPAPIGAAAVQRVSLVRRVRTRQDDIDLATSFMTVERNYFEVMGMSLVTGRAPAGEREVVVSATLSHALWPEHDPTGETLVIDSWPEMTVTGVVEVSAGSLAFGRPYAAFAGRHADWVTTSGIGPSIEFVVQADDAASARGRVEQLTRKAFPDATILSTPTGRQLVNQDLGTQLASAWFLRGFAVVAWTLSLLGVFGLVAYTVESRRRDFGIMAALGASPSQLMATSSRSGLTPAVAGVILGAVAAWWGRLGLTSLLLGITAISVPQWLVLTIAMIGAAAISAGAASWRLRRLNPLDVIREP